MGSFMTDMRVRDQTSHHCTVLEIDGCGILIEGPAGAGKTSLALGALDTAGRRGLPAYFICDDQALLSRHGARIQCRPVPSIAGKAELRGFGIIAVEYKSATAIGLIARLVDDTKVERMPLSRTGRILGVELPLLELPQRHEAQSIRILMAWLAGEGHIG